MRGQDIATVAAWAQTIGLGALDLPQDFAQGARACWEQDLRIGTVDAPRVPQLLSPDERVREQAVNAFLQQIEAMAKAGAQRLFVCLVPEDRTQPLAVSLAIFSETFPRLTAACEAAGVRIALEGYPGPGPHYPTLGYTPEVWRRMFAAVPSPALGLCYDPSHLVRLGIDYLRVLEEFKARIHHCHGKDTALLPEAAYLYGNLVPALTEPARYSGGAWRYTVPGDGLVNWRAVAFELEQAGYDGVISIELEDIRYWGSLAQEQQGIVKSFRHLAQHFQ
jgi:sugar phosphate isomerase/epimerase